MALLDCLVDRNFMAESKNEPLPEWPRRSLGLLLLGLLACYVPTYMAFANTVWTKDDSGHGPMILALALWLMWRDRNTFLALRSGPRPVAGLVTLVAGMLTYILGRSQGIDFLEAASNIVAFMACLLLLRGWAGVRLFWFPLFFMIFMIPVPGVLAQALTLPLKSAVSYCAEALLYWAGYPMGRSGVTLVVGPYKLLVADACAGLNSIFTLESLGLFYMKLMDYKSAKRNMLLAIMILPISFVSNTIRVITLVLVTYYLGDEVGQGFVHNLAGLVLFSVALLLTYGLDRILSYFFDERDHAFQ